MKDTKKFIDSLIELANDAAPFARHVAVCSNHDGSKFQKLAEDWLDSLEAVQSLQILLKKPRPKTRSK